jgi:fluoride exporter
MEFAFNRPFRLMTPTRNVYGRSLFMSIAYIALAGALGTLARFGLEAWIHGRAATLTVNLLGSLALGFIMHYAARSAAIPLDLRGALTIGFCGAFTTMSTFSYEALGLLVQGNHGRAALYMGTTIAGCLSCVLVGMIVAERLAR